MSSSSPGCSPTSTILASGFPSPQTGCVEAKADITPLRSHMTREERAGIARDDNFVPNGIAWNPATGQFILTGKYWPMLFFGRFIEN